MLIASATYQRDGWSSPTIDSSSNAQLHVNLMGCIADVENKPENFSTRNSALKSVNRALVSVFQKIVMIFQKSTRAIVSLLPCYGQVTNVKADIKSSGLLSEMPKVANVLGYLGNIQKEIDGRKEILKHNNPQKSYDFFEEYRFISSQLEKNLESVSASSCWVILNNLEGRFGQRFCSMLNFVYNKSLTPGFPKKDQMMNVSTVVGYNSLLDQLRVTLRQCLGLDDETCPSIPTRDLCYMDFTPEELRALSSVGINTRKLKT